MRGVDIKCGTVSGTAKSAGIDLSIKVHRHVAP
jgi:hypothetical protein